VLQGSQLLWDHLFIYLFIYLFVYLFVCLFVYSFVHSFIHLRSRRLTKNDQLWYGTVSYMGRVTERSSTLLTPGRRPSAPNFWDSYTVYAHTVDLERLNWPVGTVTHL